MVRRAVGKTSAARAGGRAGAHRLRIIGGRWRGSRIEFPELAAIRPSPDRVRETLFNWLQARIVGAACLDLFAGSGALGLEALSRGAAHVAFVDREPQVGAHLRNTLQRLHGTNAEVIVADSLRYLQRPPRPYDIVFLDPPFAAGMLGEVIERLREGWLAADALIYLEAPADAVLPGLPAGWSSHRTGRAGQVGYHLWKATPPPAEDTP